RRACPRRTSIACRSRILRSSSLCRKTSAVPVPVNSTFFAGCSPFGRGWRRGRSVGRKRSFRCLGIESLPDRMLKRFPKEMHYLSKAERANATGAPGAELQEDEPGPLRRDDAKIRIFRSPLRARFSFDGDYVRRLITEDPETERHF